MSSAPARTPLHSSHLAAGGRMVDFAGWEMPLSYTSVRAEQRAVREAAGLFDVSHMGRFEVRGGASTEYLQQLLTNDLSRVAPGRAQYNLMCRPDGGVIDDLVVYRTADTSWLVVVNASNRAKDMAWLSDRLRPGVELIDRSDELALIALQGPRARDLLPVEGLDLGRLAYFAVAPARVAGESALVSRTGYTGEDGFELFVPAAAAAGVWAALIEAGAVPCGLACRDVCRLEAGLRLYGSDMDETVNPYEAGLGWVVKLAKGDFCGREALAAVRAAGPARRTIGIRGEGRVIPRPHTPLLGPEGQVGTVNSGTYSFWLEAGIGMALVAAGLDPHAQLAVEQRDRPGPVRVAELPFYKGTAGRV